MIGGKNSKNALGECDYGNCTLRFKPVDLNFVKPNWDNLMTKRDKPLMSDREFRSSIEDLARKDFAAGKKDDNAYRNLGMRFIELVSPDRKAAYEASMKKTNGKMNAALMFWDEKGNRTLGYHPFTGTCHNISTEAEAGRARIFAEIYRQESIRLENEYGANARGKISHKDIQKDLSADSVKTSGTLGSSIDYKI